MRQILDNERLDFILTQFVAFENLTANEVRRLYDTGLKFFVGSKTNFSQWTPNAFQIDFSQIGGTIIDSPCN